MIYALAAIGAVTVLHNARSALRSWRMMKNTPSYFSRKAWMPR